MNFLCYKVIYERTDVELLVGARMLLFGEIYARDLYERLK